MIEAVLTCLVADLNAHLRSTQHLDEGAVVLSHLTGLDGMSAPHVENKLVILLTGIDEQKGLSAPTGFARSPTASVPPSLSLNLHVLFAATHNSYALAAKMVGEVITFFRNKPVFTAQTTPAMPAGLQQFSAVMENLGHAELTQIWTRLDVPFRPSVNYVIRTSG